MDQRSTTATSASSRLRIHGACVDTRSWCRTAEENSQLTVPSARTRVGQRLLRVARPTADLTNIAWRTVGLPVV